MDGSIKISGYLGGTQFVPASFVLLESKFVSMDEKSLYLLLCRYRAKGENKCWPSLATLVEITNWSKPTILKKIKLLEDVGLIIKKNHLYESKQNNTYILVSPEIAFGLKQLNKHNLDEGEIATLQELGYENIIIKLDGTLVICSSKKNKLLLNKFYEKIDNCERDGYVSTKYSEFFAIIREIERLYEYVASNPYVFLNKSLNEDFFKISSEEFLEYLTEIDINNIIKIMKNINLEGIPKKYEKIGRNNYILNILWKEREILSIKLFKRVI